MSESDYRIVDVTEPHGTVRTIRNHWWWALDGKPQKAVFYVGSGWRTAWSPQCNSDKRIVDGLKPPFPNAVMVHIPLAFAPQREAQ